MDSELLLIGIIALILLVGAAISVSRWIFAHGRLQGIQKAVHQLTRGASVHYEHDDKPLPKRVEKCIDQMAERITKARGAREKCRAFSVYLWDLGNVMGEAAWEDGFWAGQRSTDPRENEIRLDMSLKELINIRWLAHFGFENMVPNNDGPFSFKDGKDAEEAAYAIDRLEFCIPEEHRDPDDPYALSVNRHDMIWNRWPSKKQAP